MQLVESAIDVSWWYLPRGIINLVVEIMVSASLAKKVPQMIGLFYHDSNKTHAFCFLECREPTIYLEGMRTQNVSKFQVNNNSTHYYTMR